MREGAVLLTLDRRDGGVEMLRGLFGKDVGARRAADALIGGDWVRMIAACG